MNDDYRYLFYTSPRADVTTYILGKVYGAISRRSRSAAHPRKKMRNRNGKRYYNGN